MGSAQAKREKMSCTTSVYRSLAAGRTMMSATQRSSRWGEYTCPPYLGGGAKICFGSLL